jgi:hypothetical protein
VVLERYTKPKSSWGIHLVTPNPDFNPSLDPGWGNIPYTNRTVGLFGELSEGMEKLQDRAEPGCFFGQKTPLSEIKDQTLRHYIITQCLPMEWRDENNVVTAVLEGRVFVYTQEKYFSLVLDEV